MADIDKGLPNTRTQIKVPGEEVEIKEEIKEKTRPEWSPFGRPGRACKSQKESGN